jgi:hypothetical protein
MSTSSFCTMVGNDSVFGGVGHRLNKNKEKFLQNQNDLFSQQNISFLIFLFNITIFFLALHTAFTCKDGNAFDVFVAFFLPLLYLFYRTVKKCQ